MAHQWPVGDLDGERLLASWRWLCPQQVTPINRNVYGDLFLRDEEGKVFWLDVAGGSLSQIADSESQFLDLSEDDDKLEEWLSESDARAAAEQGLIPGPNQCIGFSVPLVFAESASANKAYIADIYDHVGFLGDLHKQTICKYRSPASSWSFLDAITSCSAASLSGRGSCHESSAFL
jgi:hypothetical protein